VSKELGAEFIARVLAPENTRTLIANAEDGIKKFFALDINPQKFALSAKYNPTKQNVAVLAFVKRMCETQEYWRKAGDMQKVALYEPPEPGDKFLYVMVQKPQRYDMQGRKVKISKEYGMEFMRVFLDSQQSPNPLQIDRAWYMNSQIMGIFARFILADKQFTPSVTYDLADKEQYKKYDNERLKLANEYLTSVSDSITGFDKTLSNQLGSCYRAQYKNVMKQIHSDLRTRHNGCMLLAEFEPDPDSNLAPVTQLVHYVESIARARAVRDTPMIEAAVKSRYRAFDADSKHMLYRAYIAVNGMYGDVTRVRIATAATHVQKLKEDLFNAATIVAAHANIYRSRCADVIDSIRMTSRERDVLLDTDALATLNDIPADVIAALHTITACAYTHGALITANIYQSAWCGEIAAGMVTPVASAAPRAALPAVEAPRWQAPVHKPNSDIQNIAWGDD
jgi:hypothetical protein